MSIAKVAEMAGVSQATVSYVINNKPGVSEETVVRVKQAVAALDYVPRSSRTKKTVAPAVTRSIAVVIPEGSMSQSPLNTKLFEALHRHMERKLLRMIPVTLPQGEDLNGLVSGNGMLSDIEGLVVLYCRSMDGARERPTVPVVTVLGHTEPFEPLKCDHVEPDNVRIGALAARFFSEKGHSHVAVMKPSTQPHAAMDMRCSSFVSAALAIGCRAESFHIPIELDLSRHPESLTADHPLFQWVEEWLELKDRSTGIFVPSDSHLAVLFNALVRRGVDPGRDVDLIGCNNESVLLQGLSPKPATIDINPDQLARTAIHMLLQRIEEGGDRQDTCATVYVEPVLVS